MGRKPKGIKAQQPEERVARARDILTQYKDSDKIRLSDSIQIPKVSQATRRKLTNQLSKLTKTEKNKLTQYTGNLARIVNFKLWNNLINKKSQNYEDVMILDDALSKGVIPEDMTVLREIDYHFFNVDSFKQLKLLIGEPQVFKGYTSTSLDSVQFKGRNATMIIRVEQGFRGALYIRSIALKKYKHQDELLFKRNLLYTIDEVITEGGENYIYVTVYE